MQLKELKEILNSMSTEQLKQELVMFAFNKTISGYPEVEFAEEDLYYTGEDDPSELYTLSELENQYGQDEIDGMEIIINKGDLFIELP